MTSEDCDSDRAYAASCQFIQPFMFVMQNCVKYKCENYANAILNIFSFEENFIVLFNLKDDKNLCKNVKFYA